MAARDVPPGLSVQERELFEHITNHLVSENALMEAYEDLASGTHAPYVGFLARIIAEDEARHHRFYEEWAESITSIATLQESADGVPFPTRDADPAALLARTDELLEFERQDIKELKQLEHKLKDVKDTTLWVLLIDIMRADTEKHIKILEFIREHAKASTKR
jgi:hypothetical protein